MIVRSFGCSFIFGTDLADATADSLYPSPSSHTWPAVISRELGLSYRCHAHGGSGNLAILDRVIKNIQPGLRDFFIINWTYIDRFDYTDPGGGPTKCNDWLCLRPGDPSQVNDVYYRDIHSEYRDKLVTLTCIQTAISVLEQAGCPFMMTYMDDLMLDRKFHTNSGIERLQDLVRPYLIDFDGQDFLAWSRDRGFEISASQHPLESAHKAAADFLTPRARFLLEQQNK